MKVALAHINMLHFFPFLPRLHSIRLLFFLRGHKSNWKWALVLTSLANKFSSRFKQCDKRVDKRHKVKHLTQKSFWPFRKGLSQKSSIKLWNWMMVVNDKICMCVLSDAVWRQQIQIQMELQLVKYLWPGEIWQLKCLLDRGYLKMEELPKGCLSF